jgi:hypothetical protein
MDGPSHDRILEILEDEPQFDWAAATDVSAGFALGSAVSAVLRKLTDAERARDEFEFAPRQVLKSIFVIARHDRMHGRKAYFEISGVENPFAGPDADAAWDAAVLAAGDGFGAALGDAGAEACGSSAPFRETYSRVVRGTIAGVLCARKKGKVADPTPLCLDVAIFAAENLNGTDTAVAFARELREIRDAFRDAVPPENELRAAALACLAGIDDGEIHEGGNSYHFPGNRVDRARKSAGDAICKAVQVGFMETSLPGAGGNAHTWRSAILPDLERRAVDLVNLESLVPGSAMPAAPDASDYEVQPDASMFETDTEPLVRPAPQLQANMSKADEVLSDMLPRLLRKVAVPMFRRAYDKLVAGWDWDAWPCDCPDPEKKPKDEPQNDGKKPEGEPKKDKNKIVPMYYQAGRCQRCDALFPRIVEMHSKFDPARADETRDAAQTAINMGQASSASRLWGDPERGPFEIAKLFMGNLGATGMAKMSFDDSDLAGLVNLMTWCRVFAAARIDTKNVQEIRNTLIGHKAAQELATPQLLEVLREALALAKSGVFDPVECTLKAFFFFFLFIFSPKLTILPIPPRSPSRPRCALH